MRINHNIAALNTYRQLGAANAGQQASMEKLSSGLRINSAKDDAAGLAISEKMRGQIRGLDMANRNAQDATSLIQTAEGALNETQDILQRMRELAVQASNDTLDPGDRGAIQNEVDQLAQEITRIAADTEFNTKNLLGEDGFTAKFHIGANAGQDITLSINNMSAKALGVNETTATAVNLTGVTGVTVTNKTEDAYTIKFAALGDKDAAEVATTSASKDEVNKEITITLKQAAGDSSDPGDVGATIEEIKAALEGTGVVTVSVADGTDTTSALTTITAAPANTSVSAATINTSKGIDISSQSSASSAITTINTAIESVSAERSKLGATQNRLEHTINNLNTSSENLTAAESRIRDVDYALAA